MPEESPKVLEQPFARVPKSTPPPLTHLTAARTRAKYPRKFSVISGAPIYGAQASTTQQALPRPAGTAQPPPGGSPKNVPHKATTRQDAPK